MDVKDAIKKRRSIRKYKDTHVSDEIINELNILSSKFYNFNFKLYTSLSKTILLGTGS